MDLKFFQINQIFKFKQGPPFQMKKSHRMKSGVQDLKAFERSMRKGMGGGVEKEGPLRGGAEL